MTTDQLKAALERRGYVVIVFTQDEEDVRLIARLGDRSMPWTISLSLLRTLTNAGNLIENEFWQINDSQHHMRHDCGFPLLREAKNAGGKETLAYRAASAGAKSGSLLECPKCLQYVQDDSVQEIGDQVDPLGWTDQDLDELAAITSADLAAASDLWEQTAPLKGLLGAEKDRDK